MQKLLNRVLRSCIGFDNEIYEKGRKKVQYTLYTWSITSRNTASMLGMSGNHLNCLIGRKISGDRDRKIDTLVAIKTYEDRLQEFDIPLWYGGLKNYRNDVSDDDDELKISATKYGNSNISVIYRASQSSTISMVPSSDTMFSIYIYRRNS